MKLELYFFPECPYCGIVLSKISELNIQNIEFKNIRENAEFRSQLLSDTGRQTVPCLYIDGKPMHESSDIARWLEMNKEELT